MAPVEANYDNSLANNSTDLVEDPKWVKLFPKCVNSNDKSCNFMTRAIYVAFSVILNRRGILNMDYFSKNYITEKLKIMALSFKNPHALRISQLIKGTGEGIKDQYIKKLALVISASDDDEEAIEAYSFEFLYLENGGVEAQLNTSNNSGEAPKPIEQLARLGYQGTQLVRDQLVNMVRSIMYMCGKLLTPLPDSYSVNFRVEYTDIAPEGYKVDGFEGSSTFYTLSEDAQSAVLGHVRPGYHASLLECGSIFMNDAYQSELAMKRHVEKYIDSDLHDMNKTFYSTMETDSRLQDPTQTRSEAAALESPGDNGTMDELSTRLEDSDIGSPKAQSTVRRGAVPKPGPYTRQRARR
uniref:HORMA domain-containing protein n=1 Tax=Caenorhabditis tropicalis TaxID=1561998 RepID=A0A1I7UWA8_9PELO